MRKSDIIVMLHENPGKELSITEDGESILTFTLRQYREATAFSPALYPEWTRGDRG